jgi:hypothetical protein
VSSEWESWERAQQLPQPQTLDRDAADALFAGELRGVVAALPRNERPLQGLAGLLDWRFGGAISRYLREGAIRGEPGELCYFPLRLGGREYHLLLAGAGDSPAPGQRKLLPRESVAAVRENLRALKLTRMGISRQDWGGIDQGKLEWEGVPVWLMP